MKLISTVFLILIFFLFDINAAEMPRYYRPQAFSYVSSIIPNADNGFTLLGYFKELPSDPFTPRVIKFDQKGDVQWEKSFANFPLLDFSGVDEGVFYKTPDNGYMLVNTYPSLTNNGRYGVVRKFNARYDSVYTVFTGLDSIGLDETFLNGWNLSVNKIVPTANGGFAIAGSNLRDCYNKGYILATYSGTGSLTWKEITPLTNGCVQFRYDAALAMGTSNGGFIFGIANRVFVPPNRFNGIFNLVRKNAAGGTIWLKTLTTSYDVSQVANKNVLVTQKELSNGNFKFLTVYDVNGGDYTSGTFLQYTISPTDSLLKTDTFNFQLPLAGSENFRKIEIDKDENIIILGQKSLTKLDKTGRLIWQREPFDELRIYDNPGVKYHLTCYSETPDGNYIVAGNSTETTNNNNSSAALFYITGDGKMKTKIIYGGIFVDLDSSCTFNNEKGYQNLVVKAEKYNQAFYTITDTAGYYNLPVDTGIYKVSFQLPNSIYWKSCQSFYTATLISASPSVNVSLPMQPKVHCPFLNVEVSVPYLRKCFPNNYSVYYCNSGTDTARNAYITLDLDNDLQVNSSTLPWSSTSGNQYRFNIGNIPPQACGNFKVNATVKCSAIDGKTHCVTAHIYPDQLCVPNSVLWDGSDISIEGTCEGDTAVFKIKNRGTGNMSGIRKYIVIEGDFLRVAPQDYLLNANDSITLRIAAAGQTIRVQAQQDPNFPYPSLPSATIESCSSTIDSLGLVNQFPQNDGAAFLSSSCVVNRNSFDPNEKTAQPVGYQEQHIVSKDTEIKYTIHFQNTGTDTAYNVTLLDTISPALDMSTLTIIGSSHPYTYSVFGGNIVFFTFPGINLPDSTADLEGSNGYVSFHVTPKATIPDGTLATNTAQIYFDYNAAISTNQVYHTIDSIRFRITWIKTNPKLLSEIKVFPNPFAGKARVVVKAAIPTENMLLMIYDINGKEVTRMNGNSEFVIDGEKLNSGLYLLQLMSGSDVLATGKIVKQ